ncbi:MAG: hypothetical protein M3Z32_09855, partial [Acidobacteriota bacterium]|nr:hypothetical protein [Acidobacteriota bacterium]
TIRYGWTYISANSGVFSGRAGWRGLAGADLQVEDFRGVQTTLSKVIPLTPNDPEAQQQLEFVANVSDDGSDTAGSFSEASEDSPVWA